MDCWQPRMRIRIGLPCYNKSMPRPVAHGLAEVSQVYDIDLRTAVGCYTFRGRNMTLTDNCSMSQKLTGFDYYLAMDNDIIVTVDAIRKLLEKNLDIIGAAYMTRNDDINAKQIVAGYWDKTPGDSPRSLWINVSDVSVRRVDWIGMGCTLIKRSVFDKLEYPYFRHVMIRYNHSQEQTGEDIGFCLQCEKAGIQVYVDCDNRVEHMDH